MNFTLYTADCIGNLKNCIYTNKIAIKDKETLIAAVGKWTCQEKCSQQTRNILN